MKNISKKSHFLVNGPLFKDFLGKKNVLLFLDYDGTLAPIVETPEKAEIDQKTKKLLENLSALSDCQIAIVSGRAMNDIKKRINLKKIIYVGNHGFEILGPNICFENSHFPQSRKIFQRILKTLRSGLQDVKGVIFEDKGATLSVHYRLVEDKQIKFFEKVFQKTLKTYAADKELRVRKGKKVYEIRPPIDWDKGKAVLWLLKENRNFLENEKAVAIYIGDDETDEDAFDVLKEKALTIRVGKSESSKAKYYLEDVEEVKELLKKILLLKK
jgi:trehalose-phosphatase